VMANNTERMRIAAQVLAAAATGGLSGIGALGGGGPKPPGKGTVSERGGELNAAQEVGAELDQSLAAQGGQGDGQGGDASLASLSPGKQFRVTQFRQQFAGGSGTGTGTTAPQGNIYVAPKGITGDAFSEKLVRFVVEFTNKSGSPVDKGDKMVEIRASGGQYVWSQQFPASLFGMTSPSKQQEKVVSPRLWNDETFEYDIFAGVQFVSTVQGEPVKRFYSNTLSFKLPRTGVIRLRLKLAEDQHMSDWLPATPQAIHTAFAKFRSRWPMLGVSGINDAMRSGRVIGRRPGEVMYAFFYFTGDMTLERAPSP
jgi:hypothetical protein